MISQLASYVHRSCFRTCGLSAAFVASALFTATVFAPLRAHAQLAGSALTIRREPVPVEQPIDLTEEGELFWMAPGDAAEDGSDLQGASPVVWAKATMPEGPFLYRLQAYPATVGSPAPKQQSFWGYADGRMGFTWSDGAPVLASQTQRAAGWQLRHTADGSNEGARFAFIMFRPLASNGWRRLDLYIDCQGDRGELVVELGAAPGPHLQQMLGAEEMCQDYLSADKVSVYFIDPWMSGLNVQLLTRDDAEEGPGLILQAVTLSEAGPPAAPAIPVAAYEPPLETESKSASGCALGGVQSKDGAAAWLATLAVVLGGVERRRSRSNSGSRALRRKA